MIHLLLAIIYLSFIGLGLPDALLGSAWPIMYPQFGVSVSNAGVIFTIIALGTVFSSLLSDRITRKFGAGKVTAVSTAVTAVALLGFSISHSFIALCLWAVPYGLGAGGVDAALNNYVAIHYASRHMSWLHCMWGLGASVGPYFMGMALSGGMSWNWGYRYVAMLQAVLAAALFLTLSLWKAVPGGGEQERESAPLTMGQLFRIPGVPPVLITFFCYCGLEQTVALWASSYLVLHRGMPEETAAGFACLFYIGITVGRGLSGFLTLKLNDDQMIFLGQGVVAAGIVLLIVPAGDLVALTGLLLVGLGCAPIYPSVIHSTPSHFGASRSQAIIGVQMASAYVGTCLLPPCFGLLAEHMTAALLPVYMLVILAVMFFSYRMVQARCGEMDEPQ